MLIFISILFVVSIICLEPIACSSSIPSSMPTHGTETGISAQPRLCSPCECLHDAEDNGRTFLVDCSRRNLSTIPTHLPRDTVAVKLDDNVLASFDGSTKGICQLYENVKSVSLAKNSLKGKELFKLLKGCDETLEELDLTGNSLSLESSDVFHKLGRLVTLKGLTLRSTLRKEIFDPLKSLKILDLSYSRLSLPVNLFEGLGNLRKLYLHLDKVRKIRDAPLRVGHLDELTINGPKIRVLPKSFFTTLRNLSRLGLQLPQLSTLEWPNKTFFSSLKHLSIQGVWKVNAETLAGMKSLKKLELCDIFDLGSWSMLNDLRQLEVLHITNSAISKLDPKALFHLSHLRNIDLSRNKIAHIPSGFLDPVRKTLETLSMNRNMLEELNDDIFPFMKNLVAIDLSENSLLNFNLNISLNTPSLVQLELQTNSISKISGRLASAIQRVNVSYNMLDHVPTGLLVGSLLDLDLSGNYLDHDLPVASLTALTNLTELSINLVTVKCDCSMEQLVRSKTVHGGVCLAETNDSQGRIKSVSDLLNDAVCPETSAIQTRKIRQPHVMRSLNNVLKSDQQNSEKDNNTTTTIVNKDDVKSRVRDAVFNNKTTSGDVMGGNMTMTNLEVVDDAEENIATTRNNAVDVVEKYTTRGVNDTQTNKVLGVTVGVENMSTIEWSEYNYLVNKTKTTDVPVTVTSSSKLRMLAEKLFPNVEPKNNDTLTKTELDDGIVTATDDDDQDDVIEDVEDVAEEKENGVTTTKTQVTETNCTDVPKVEVDLTDYDHERKHQQAGPEGQSNDKGMTVMAYKNESLPPITSETEMTINNDPEKRPGSGSNLSLSSHDVIFPVVIVPVIGIVAFCLVYFLLKHIWRRGRSGSHSLDHNRQNIPQTDWEQGKMVMTELGKTLEGHQVVVM